MTDALRIGLTELLRKAQMEDNADFLREGMRVYAEAVMELEVTQHLGAERHARTAARTGQRNGYRERSWDTRVGTIDLQVPRVRDGSYFPALLDLRRGAGSVRCRSLDAAGGRSRTGAGNDGDQQKPGVPAVRRP